VIQEKFLGGRWIQDAGVGGFKRLTPFGKNDWWYRPFADQFVLNEMIKLAGYRVILSLPAIANSTSRFRK